MARDNDIVTIKGAAEFSGAIRKVQGDLPKHMQKAFKAIADHVVGVAQQRMPFGHGVAQRALKPRATGRGKASILYPAGGPDSRYDRDGFYPWLDFGGGKAGARGITSSTGASHARSTGGFKRPVIQKGRYLYPAIAESGPYISDAVDKEMRYLIVAAGFDTEGHV